MTSEFHFNGFSLWDLIGMIFNVDIASDCDIHRISGWENDDTTDQRRVRNVTRRYDRDIHRTVSLYLLGGSLQQQRLMRRFRRLNTSRILSRKDRARNAWLTQTGKRISNETRLEMDLSKSKSLFVGKYRTERSNLAKESWFHQTI